CANETQSVAAIGDRILQIAHKLALLQAGFFIEIVRDANCYSDPTQLAALLALFNEQDLGVEIYCSAGEPSAAERCFGQVIKEA
ncbi:MAG TPA: hypothetical protein VH369_20620, partial [Bryobacteraceae bacterium]